MIKPKHFILAYKKDSHCLHPSHGKGFAVREIPHTYLPLPKLSLLPFLLKIEKSLVFHKGLFFNLMKGREGG